MNRIETDLVEVLLNPIHRIAKELDRMTTDIGALKAALADVVTEAQAAVELIGTQRTEIAAKDKKITELEAGGAELPEAEATEITDAASAAAASLRAAVEPAAPETPVS
jgi:hypothetical protein